jgi:cytochrome c oxidase cbb3-type subunit 1
MRMMVMPIAFYGMSTFEGPIMSIKTVNSLSHYTDWTIGHVHSGALGWVGMISFGAIYALVPWLWNRERLYSLKLIDLALLAGDAGHRRLRLRSMWVSGIMQGLMWRDLQRKQGFAGLFLRRDSMVAMHPYYVMHAPSAALHVPDPAP